MKKAALLLVLFGWFALPASAAPNYVAYNCELAEGGTARFGLKTMAIVFPTESTSRAVVTFLLKEGGTDVARAVTYSHIGNVHTGQYKGARRYGPVLSFDPPEFATSQFNNFLLQESEDRTVALVAFPGTKKSEYICR